jgi:hypothetical protein
MKLLPVLLAALMLLGSLPVLATVTQAEDVTPTAYPLKTVDGGTFDMSDHSFYGAWSIGQVHYERAVDDRAYLTGSYDIGDKTKGSASRTVTMSWTECNGAWAFYDFDFNATIPALRHYTVEFDYKISVTGNASAASADLFRRTYIDTPLNLESMAKRESLLADNQWHTWTGTFYDTSGTSDWKYQMRFWFSFTGGSNAWAQTYGSTGSIQLHLDNMRFTAPECKVRFSYYNAFTGLGLQSDLLIPEVWHDGTWTRLWGNEYSMAAGEMVAYRVSDYFGQTIAFVPELWLDDTAVYVDLPVKLVKVHITKPTWYTTDLPPSWWLTYSATGTEIPVEGWDLELIAGFYSFRWDEMTVSKGSDALDESDDLVVQNGTIGQYIDGNLTTGQSFTVSDFYLSMQPTYRSETNSTMSIIPSFYSWDGLIEAFNQLYDEISGNPIYKSVTLVMGIAGAITFVTTFYYKGKKQAAIKLRQEQEKRGGSA